MIPFFFFPPTLGAASLLCCPGNEEYSLMTQPPTWTPTQWGLSLLHRMFILFGTGCQGDTNLGVTHLPVTEERVIVAGDVFEGREAQWGKLSRRRTEAEKRPFISFLQAPVRPASFGIATAVSHRWQNSEALPFFALAERNETEEMFFSLCLILTGLELWLTETLDTVLTNGSVVLKTFPHLYLVDMTTS